MELWLSVGLFYFLLNPGLKVPSIVQLEQIFTIDKRRVQRFAGQASEEEMRRIETALKISLQMI